MNFRMGLAWACLTALGCGSTAEGGVDGGTVIQDVGGGMDVVSVAPDVGVPLDRGSASDVGAPLDRGSAPEDIHAQPDVGTGPVDTGPGICSASNPGGQCPPGQSCMGGLCVSPCSSSSPGGYCPAHQTCIGGSCCASPCDSRCCTGNTYCVGPIGTSNLCVAHCNVSSDCGAGSWCAALGTDDGFCVPPGEASGNPRRCAIDTDCTGGQACTPTIGTDGLPRRPYICTDPACTPYHQCRGVLGSCPNGYCNLCAASGRCYCAQVCTSDAMCGSNATCTVFGTSHGSCPSTQTACAAR